MVVHTGACFCGAVRLEATGEPQGMGYCHCNSCRSWSCGPVNAFTLWKPANVRISQGREHVAVYNKTTDSSRTYCAKCGGPLMTDHSALGVIDVFSATLPSLMFTPDLHINYAESVLPMRDGLPKFKDFPTPFGGSNLMLPD